MRLFDMLVICLLSSYDNYTIRGTNVYFEQTLVAIGMCERGWKLTSTYRVWLKKTVSCCRKFISSMGPPLIERAQLPSWSKSRNFKLYNSCPIRSCSKSMFRKIGYLRYCFITIISISSWDYGWATKYQIYLQRFGSFVH